MSGGECITVYADILLLVNFSMDILSLYLTFSITHQKITKHTLIVSSLLGAFIGSLTLLYLPSDWCGGLIEVILGVLTAFLMIVISHKKKKIDIRSLIFDSLILWGVGTLLSGIMTFLIDIIPKNNDYYSKSSFTEVFILCCGISCLIVKVFSVSKTKRTETVSFVYNGRTIECIGLCDSGSFACDPITLLPVIIVSRNVLGDIEEKLYSGNINEIRIIPIKTVSGEKVLYGFIPEKVMLGTKEVNAVIASDGVGNSYGGYDGLIPSKLI